MPANGSEIIRDWPEESREATKLVIDKYGEPDEATTSELIWHRPGEWKRIVASRTFWHHNFPAPHIDVVESFIDYRVPPEKFSDLAEFDGSVIVERTAGEVSARCHDEEANRLALNLIHDISLGGLKVEPIEEYCVGKEVTVVVESLRPIKGEVRWYSDRRAGIVFKTPLGFEELAEWVGKRLEVASLKASTPRH